MYNFDSMQKQNLQSWFKSLRDQICLEFESIEAAYCAGQPGAKFTRTPWTRTEGGGGVMSVMRGKVFEKVGVNISTVSGQFSPEFASKIPGTEQSREFWASGISLVAHMCSPHVPAVHMNTRAICTAKSWFGGGADLTPIYPNIDATELFHKGLKDSCDRHDPAYYSQFSKQCDEYFFLPHRNEPRGVGGIFYDYMNCGSFEKDFAFTQDVGTTFLHTYPKIIYNNMHNTWTEDERAVQLQKRGRYVEFNLLHDRGTLFGLQTGGNIEAILMSLPPQAAW